MTQFTLTKAALADLKSIGRFTQNKWGQAQRNHYLGLLDQAFHILAANPMIGRDCYHIRPDYRQYVIGKHVIFYRDNQSGKIEIVRILHQRMMVDTEISDGHP